MTMPLVRGMPYLTANYSGLTPRIQFSESPIKLVNGEPPPARLKDASRVELELESGQLWTLYASRKVEELSIEANSVTASRTYDDLVLRAAVVTTATRALLDQHSARVPLGGSVLASANGPKLAQLSFSWTSAGSGPLLVMALPHHLPRLSGGQRTALVHNTLKGDMVGITGDTWILTEDLPEIEWGAPRAITDAFQRDAVRGALLADVQKPLLAADPYGGGKEMGALARLALIADELDEREVASSLRRRLSAKLEEWLTGGGADRLQYEPTYGGLVSQNGLADRAADFGNGWYNDHHFHYGYFLYSAAVVGKQDRAWLQKWSPALLHLVRDIANPSDKDPLYPQNRFKDWYVGHAWASGLFTSASGRNQESVSEAINAWHGLHLFGLALGDERLRDLGRLMIATEARAAWYYWQIVPSSSTTPTIYPAPFAANRLAAVVWSAKVDRFTWFGQNPEYAFGIQAMPFTPISELLLRPEWVESSRPVWEGALTDADDQWRGLLLMLSAVTKPADAWESAQKLKLFDNGNSRTNMLWWIATRNADNADVDDATVVPTPNAGGERATDTHTNEPGTASPVAGLGTSGALVMSVCALGLAAAIGVRYSKRLQFWLRHRRPMTSFEAQQMEAASAAPGRADVGSATNYQLLNDR